MTSLSTYEKVRLRLVFSSDGVGDVIRSVELYDLMKTKFWFFSVIPLTTPFLQSSENWVVGVASRSGRTQLITKRGNVHYDIGLSFRFFFRLRQFGLHWIILKRNVGDGVLRGVGRKWKRSDSSDSDSVSLITPLTTPIFFLTTQLTTPTHSEEE